MKLPVTRIYPVFAMPDIDLPAAVFRIGVAGATQTPGPGWKLRLRVDSPDGERFTHEEDLHLAETQSSAGLDLEVPVKFPKAVLWELDEPRLYRVHASLVDDRGEVADTGSAEFGMRKIETKGDRVYLNHKPIYLVGGGLDPGPYGGAVDINWHLPPPYALPTDEEIQRDILTTKSVGVNFARVPLRSADPRFLYWADRMGLLVMQGGPWTPTEGIAGAAGFTRYKDWWTEAVRRDRNHPSLVLWELFNESFGMS